jgi:hypothetical protein
LCRSCLAIGVACRAAGVAVHVCESLSKVMYDKNLRFLCVEVYTSGSSCF